MTNNGNGTYNATYIPDDCGRYKVDVKYAGKNIPRAPFNVQAYATGDVCHADYSRILDNTLLVLIFRQRNVK